MSLAPTSVAPREGRSSWRRTMRPFAVGTLIVATLACSAVCSKRALRSPRPGAVGEQASGQQAQWTPREIPAGTEFRLHNDEGAQVIIQCLPDGVAVGFQVPVGPFPRFASIDRVAARGFPGQQRNIAVSLRGNRSWSLFEVLNAGGRDFVFRTLRSAAELSVRMSPSTTASFEVFGSGGIVSECLNHVEDDFGGLGSPRQPGASGGPLIPIR